MKKSLSTKKGGEITPLCYDNMITLNVRAIIQTFPLFDTHTRTHTHILIPSHLLHPALCLCVCVCVCERERERERERAELNACSAVPCSL